MASRKRADHGLLSRHQQDFLTGRSVGAHVLADNLEIKHDLVDRDRDVVLSLKLDGAPQLVLGHLRHIDVADYDLLIAHGQLDGASSQLVLS